VLELHAVPAKVIGCFGRPEALDRLAKGAEGVRRSPLLSVRVAPDELLLLSESPHVAELEAELGALDDGSLVLDLSCGFAIWALRGDGRFEAFIRLSALSLPEPPAVIQGLVAHVPAKVIVGSDALLLIVSSVVAHHLRERVLLACADLAPSEGGAFRPTGVLIEEGGRV
jgi:hypothetical protein